MAKRYYSYNTPTKRRIKWFFVSCLAVVVILGIASLYIRHLYLENLQPVNGSTVDKVVTIPTGASLPTIASDLQKAGVIRSSWAFEWFVRNDSNVRNELEAGTYTLHPDQSVQVIVKMISEGKVAGNLVVILPGQRIDQISEALVHDGFSASSVSSALQASTYQYNYSMFGSQPLPDGSLEGFLYPDSFAKTDTTQVSQIVQESLAEMQSKITPQIISGFAKNGLSVYQGVTLASIVEQEVSNPSDKPIVAQVFISRLKQGMDLGSDVTAFYGAIINNQPPSVNYDSPYNTRLHAGLPPGPISNVTSVDLNAVANPSNTNYLYFVTGDNGVTYYAQTLAQHDQQVQDYCQKLCANS